MGNIQIVLIFLEKVGTSCSACWYRLAHCQWHMSSHDKTCTNANMVCHGKLFYQTLYLNRVLEFFPITLHLKVLATCSIALSNIVSLPLHSYNFDMMMRLHCNCCHVTWHVLFIQSFQFYHGLLHKCHQHQTVPWKFSISSAHLEHFNIYQIHQKQWLVLINQ